MFYGDSSDYLHLLPDDWRELLEIKVISNGVNIQLDKVLDRIKALECIRYKGQVTIITSMKEKTTVGIPGGCPY